VASRPHRALRWLVTAAAASATVVSTSVAALEPNATARILAGLNEAPAALGPNARPMIRQHARAISERWETYQRRIGEPMRDWARMEVGAAGGAPVFYPFSGPDFVTVEQLYPDAARFVLVAIQRAGPPPALDRYSPRELSELLAKLQAAWDRFARLGFFRTQDLESGVRIEVTGLLMAFAARAGYEVVSVDPVRVSADGADLEPRPGDRSSRAAWESVRLTLAKAGRTVLLDYVRLDLSDASLSRQRADRAWLEAMAGHRTVVKAASHLLQRPHYAILRDAILASAPSIWQDETGIDYAQLAREFDVTLYGRFTKSNRLFTPGSQHALAAAYARQPELVRPLGFRVGYEKASGSSVQVAVRAANGHPREASSASLERQIQALEARVAKQTEHLAAQPRKAYVGGLTDEAPFADYVQGVRKRLIASAGGGASPPGRPALLALSIGRDGVLRDVDIDRSSGSPAFDRQLRAAARRVGAFAPLPEAVRERAEVLVIVFQIPDR